MADIYEQFDAATRGVGAYAILKDGVNVGRVVFKHPRDGAGRLYAYVQVWGAPMVRGHANGFGYDKASAAVEAAVAKLVPREGEIPDASTQANIDGFKLVMAGGDGERWSRRLEIAGYTVAGVV